MWQAEMMEEVKLKLLRCHWKAPERSSITELEKVTPGAPCLWVDESESAKSDDVVILAGLAGIDIN